MMNPYPKKILNIKQQFQTYADAGMIIHSMKEESQYLLQSIVTQSHYQKLFCLS